MCYIFKMLLSIFTVITLLHGINAGEVVVLHSPKSLGFKSEFGKQQFMLKELYAAALGISTPQKSCSNSIYFADPFDTPEAVVEVYVPGVSNVGPFEKEYKVYSMEDKNESDTYEFVTKNIAKYETNLQSSKLVKFHLNDPDHLQVYKDVFKYASVGNLPKFPQTTLNSNNPTQKKFIEELAVLRIIIAAVRNNNIKRDYIKDFYHLRLNSLFPLIEEFGPDSVEVSEAKRMLQHYLEELTLAFVNVYSGDVMVTLVTSSSDKGGYRREQRQLEENALREALSRMFPLDEEELFRLSGSASALRTKPEKKITPAEVHLIFWTCFVLSFTLIAIVQVFMNLDPGKDSVVYRLTDNLIRYKE